MNIQPEQTLHSLAFVLAHQEDVHSLGEHGETAPPHVDAQDWARLWTVIHRAHAQVDAVLNTSMEHLAATLRPTGARLERVTRQDTARSKWEAWGRLMLPRARKPFAYLGVNLGLPSPLASGCNLFFGHASARNIRGLRLGEALRHRGVQVAVATGRTPYEGWIRGTVVLGGLDIHPTTTVASSSASLVATLEGTLVQHWDAVVAS